MGLDIYEHHHGAALVQLVNDPAFTALNRLEPRVYGGYLINDDRHLYLKHSSARSSPWQFTFADEQVAPVRRSADTTDHTYVGFVCGADGVAVVTAAELFEIVGPRPGRGVQQPVQVRRPPRGSYRVASNGHDLSRLVPKNRFPGLVLS